MNMNKKITFGVIASFSLFSCFAASDDQRIITGILKKPFCMSGEQASFVVEVGRVSKRDGSEKLVSDSLVTLLSKYNCTSIVLARGSKVRIINETNAIEVFGYEEFKNVVGRGISCSLAETFEGSQKYKLKFEDLAQFKIAWIPLMVPEAENC